MLFRSRIRLLKPELVLDFHTTTAEQPDLLITADKNNEVAQRFINASAVKDILVVEPLNDITTVMSNFAAYEVPNSHLNDDLYEQICADIARYLDEETVDQERTFYKMTGKILFEEEQNIAGLKNFVYKTRTPRRSSLLTIINRHGNPSWSTAASTDRSMIVDPDMALI